MRPTVFSIRLTRRKVAERLLYWRERKPCDSGSRCERLSDGGACLNHRQYAAAYCLWFKHAPPSDKRSHRDPESHGFLSLQYSKRSATFRRVNRMLKTVGLI